MYIVYTIHESYGYSYIYSYQVNKAVTRPALILVTFHMPLMINDDES